MRKRFILFALVAIAGLTAAAAAWAGFPNILRYKDPELVYGSTSSSTRTLARAAENGAFSDPRVFVGEIVVTDVDHSVNVTLTASFRATYVCAHGGVAGTGSTALVGRIAGSAVFPVERRHTATGSVLTQALPSAAYAGAVNGFACLNGETLAFDRAVFSNLTLAAAGGERLELHGTLTSHPVFG